MFNFDLKYELTKHRGLLYREHIIHTYYGYKIFTLSQLFRTIIGNKMPIHFSKVRRTRHRLTSNIRQDASPCQIDVR
jgi:hypothetical protein